MSWLSTLPGLVPARRFWQSSLGFLAAISLVYAVCIVSATLTLHAYFAQTWDVVTFIQAGRALLDGNPFDLYAQSRTTQTWPYAYPPLHALVSALALIVGDGVRALPDFVWVRVPPMLADIGVAVGLYRIVARKADVHVARIAALGWLFNPITFYDTAVQGHFESEWLLLVLLAYAWFERQRCVAASIALALAVLFKQIAILFVVPIYVFLLVRWWNQRTTQPLNHLIKIFVSALIFATVIIAACLPFLLYSDDFWFMNLTYVENVPVQTQSWIVALLGWTRTAPNALTSDFFLLRYQTLVALFAALVIAFIVARRGGSVYLAATLIALVFFLTSRKVMGYYYVMLFPFLLVELASQRRFDLMRVALVATTYIALSPYYAAWVNHAHWWLYATLGALNSLFFVWLLWKVTNDGRPTTDANALVALMLGLFGGAVGAAWLQPLVASPTSPIRAPIIAPGFEAQAMLVLALLCALVVLVGVLVSRAMPGTHRAWWWSVILAPLFFAVFTLTKETTAIFEIALKALGV